jgi:flagellar FliL protein
MVRFCAALLLWLLPLAGAAAPAAGDPDKSTGSGPYFAMEPLVVNVRDGARLRFMQVKMQLLSNDPRVLSALKANVPPLRDAMIMLLAHQEAERVQTMEGREALRAQALAAAQQVFGRVTGVDPQASPAAAGIEAIYFTDFIIQ